jgi:etoposide-induced 2.4 mRNA
MVGKEALDLIHYWVEWIYFVLWIAPVYLLTFILNALWYQDIASESIRIYPMKRPPSFSSSIAGEIAGLIHRSIFNVCFLVYLAFIRNWKLLYLLNLSWLIAYNSFEYQWIHFKVSFETKIKTIETNWVYFSFFGLPLALIAFQFPSIIENGLISVAFPFVLMMASTASRPLCVGSGQWFQRMRILIVPDLMTRIFVFFLNFANRDRR